MSKDCKKTQKGPFFELDEKRRKAIEMLFEDELTDEEIAKSIGRSRTTLSKWKNDELFKKAQKQYRSLVVKDDYTNMAIKKLKELLEAKSEMVQLQSATTILKMAGMLSDNDTPELTRAKVRKANADARVAEARAKSLEDNGQDVATALDAIMNKLTRESDKADSNK